MLISKSNAQLAACSADRKNPVESGFRLDHLRIDQKKNTITAIDRGSMFISALPDQALESEFPSTSNIFESSTCQPQENHVYIPATAFQAATKALQKLKLKGAHADLPILEFIRLTQTTGPYPKYLLETNDLTTLSLIPTPATNENEDDTDTDTKTDRIMWPNVNQMKFNSNTALENQDTPAPEVTLDMQHLKTLVKILKAHNVKHVRIQVVTQDTPAPIKIYDADTRDDLGDPDPQITAYLMPMIVTSDY